MHAASCRSAGAHGMRRAGELLVAAADRADSIAERRLTGPLRRAGMDDVVLAHSFGQWTIDLAFPTLLRFTWQDVMDRPEAVVAQIRSASGRASA